MGTKEKRVYFTIIVPIAKSTEKAAKKALRPLIKTLITKADELGLEIEQGRFFQAFRYSTDDARVDLAIKKIKGVTYQQIYAMVNSVQVVSFQVR